MKKLIFIFCFASFISCTSNAQTQKTTAKKFKVSKTDAEWRKQLTPKQYNILREAGTEAPFSSELDQNFKDGVYVCAACNAILYKSDNKYDAHCGWPSFDQAIKGAIVTDVDYKLGYARIELKCAVCGSHLGHVFDDGPKETTGQRHCVDGTALKFIAKADFKKYGIKM